MGECQLTEDDTETYINYEGAVGGVDSFLTKSSLISPCSFIFCLWLYYPLHIAHLAGSVYPVISTLLLPSISVPGNPA